MWSRCSIPPTNTVSTEPPGVSESNRPQTGGGETRFLYPFAREPLRADFSFARARIVRRHHRTVKKSGQTTIESRYYLSSVPPAHYRPLQWLQLIRGHWAGVSIRNHWRRDALLGEDASRSRNPHLPANLAPLRSALLALRAHRCPDPPPPPIIEELNRCPTRSLNLLGS